MTSTEKRIYNDVKKHKNKVKIFWDIDGTFASMEMQCKDQKLEKGFFYKKRPIKTNLKILKKFFKMGAQTYILSFCSFYYQKEDKERWLEENCPFLKKENYIIIPRKEADVKPYESKHELKAAYMRDYINNGDIVYMIDDNETTLLKTKEILDFINIVCPIDFVK